MDNFTFVVSGDEGGGASRGDAYDNARFVLPKYRERAGDKKERDAVDVLLSVLEQFAGPAAAGNRPAPGAGPAAQGG